jgi:hypothetical protein
VVKQKCSIHSKLLVNWQIKYFYFFFLLSVCCLATCLEITRSRFFFPAKAISARGFACSCWCAVRVTGAGKAARACGRAPRQQAELKPATRGKKRGGRVLISLFGTLEVYNLQTAALINQFIGVYIQLSCFCAQRFIHTQICTYI